MAFSSYESKTPKEPELEAERREIAGDLRESESYLKSIAVKLTNFFKKNASELFSCDFDKLIEMNFDASLYQKTMRDPLRLHLKYQKKFWDKYPDEAKLLEYFLSKTRYTLGTQLMGKQESNSTSSDEFIPPTKDKEPGLISIALNPNIREAYFEKKAIRKQKTIEEQQSAVVDKIKACNKRLESLIPEEIGLTIKTHLSSIEDYYKKYITNLFTLNEQYDAKNELLDLENALNEIYFEMKMIIDTKHPNINKSLILYTQSFDFSKSRVEKLTSIINAFETVGLSEKVISLTLLRDENVPTSPSVKKAI